MTGRWLSAATAAGRRVGVRGWRVLVRGALGALRWGCAYGLAYPVRAGLTIASAVLVFTGLPLWACAALWGASAAVLQGLTFGILRRSLRDPFESIALVKSLRLASRVRRRWPRAMHRAGLEKTTRGVGEPARPRRRRVRVTRYGVRTTVNVAPIGATADELRAKRRSIESSFRAVDSRVQETGPGWALLELRHTDPLHRKVTTRDLPRPTRRRHVVVGVDENGAGVEKDLRLPHLIVGAQGSGKSTEAWTTIRALQVARVPFRLRVFDPKFQEFAGLANAAHVYERNPLAWGRFLGSALGGLMTRQADLAERGVQKLSWFTDSEPFDLMLIDELVTVLTMKLKEVVVNTPSGRLTMTPGDALLLYLSQARAAGYGVLALSQVAEKAVIGPIRGLFGYVTLLRVGPTEEEIVNVVLGTGTSKAYPAHKLPAGEQYAGIGYMDAGPPHGVVKYRAARLSEVERHAVVKRLAADTTRQRLARAQAREPEPQPQLEAANGHKKAQP